MPRNSIAAHNPIGKRISALMKAKGHTIRSLASVANVPRSTLGAWIAGSIPSDFDAVWRVAQSLKVSFSFLLTGEIESSSPASELMESDFNKELVFEGLAEVKLLRLRPVSEAYQQNRKETSSKNILE